MCKALREQKKGLTDDLIKKKINDFVEQTFEKSAEIDIKIYFTDILEIELDTDPTTSKYLHEMMDFAKV